MTTMTNDKARKVADRLASQVRYMFAEWLGKNADKNLYHQSAESVKLDIEDTITTALLQFAQEQESGAVGELVEALQGSDYALESLNAILCGELSRDWSEVYGADWNMMAKARGKAAALIAKHSRKGPR